MGEKEANPAGFGAAPGGPDQQVDQRGILPPDPEAAAASSEVVVTGPPKPPDGRRRRLNQSKFETLALLVHSATPNDQIAEVLGVSVDTIRYYTSGQSAGYNAVAQEIRERLVRTQVHHLNRLSSLMEDGYEAVKCALREKTDSEAERRLRADTAFKLFDRVIPQKSDTQVEVTQNTIHVHQEIRQTFAPVMERFTELVDLALKQDPTKHVREGAAALPSAYADATSKQPKVDDVEFADSEDTDK